MYWQELLAEWLVAVRKNATHTFFISGVENRNNQRTTYQTLGSIQAYTDYLIRMADQEKHSVGHNIMTSTTFGVTRNGQL